MVVCPTGDTCPRLPTQEPDALTIPRPIVCHVSRALAARLPRFAYERRLSIERSVHVPVLARPALRRAACGARREWCAGVAAAGQPLGGQHRGQGRHRCQRRRDQQHDLRHGRAQRRRPRLAIREVRSARHHEELLGRDQLGRWCVLRRQTRFQGRVFLQGHHLRLFDLRRHHRDDRASARARYGPRARRSEPDPAAADRHGSTGGREPGHLPGKILRQPAVRRAQRWAHDHVDRVSDERRV